MIALSLLLLCAADVDSRPPGYGTLAELRELFDRSPEARTLLDEFLADGWRLEEGRLAFRSGAYCDPSGKRIKLDKTQIKDLPTAAGILLFELIRSKYAACQIALDQQAKEGTLLPDEYAIASEQESYRYLQESHEIAQRAVDAGDWPAECDPYAKAFTPGAAYASEASYLRSAKKTGHYERFLLRYDLLRGVKQQPKIAVVAH